MNNELFVIVHKKFDKKDYEKDIEKKMEVKGNIYIFILFCRQSMLQDLTLCWGVNQFVYNINEFTIDMLIS